MDPSPRQNLIGSAGVMALLLLAALPTVLLAAEPTQHAVEVAATLSAQWNDEHGAATAATACSCRRS